MPKKLKEQMDMSVMLALIYNEVSEGLDFAAASFHVVRQAACPSYTMLGKGK